MARSSQYLRRTPAWGAPAAAICALTLQNTICAQRTRDRDKRSIIPCATPKARALHRAIVIAAVRPACCACEPHDMRAARHLGATEPDGCSHADRCRRAPAAPQSDLFSRSLAESDPELFGCVAARAWPPAERDRADRLGEHRLARRARGHGQACSPTSTPKAIPATATTAAASTSTRPRTWPSSAPRSCSAAASPTCSRTRAARPTRRHSWR